jgi:copper resistance protein B
MSAAVRRVLVAGAAALWGVAVLAAEGHHHPAAGARTMEQARAEMYHHMGGQTFTMVSADRFEYVGSGAHDQVRWDLDIWHGGDLNKLWVKTEGERGVDGSGTESFEVQALYSRAISPYFDLQLGVRQEFRPSPQRTHAVIGLQGLAPYWFEVDVAAFVSERGDVTARAEIEYELLLTQRLILQPRVELGFAAQRVAERAIGSGLTGVEAGLRLRYEIRREFAPYVGVEWHRTLGDSRALARALGDDLADRVWVSGIRFWF